MFQTPMFKTPEAPHSRVYSNNTLQTPEPPKRRKLPVASGSSLCTISATQPGTSKVAVQLRLVGEVQVGGTGTSPSSKKRPVNVDARK